MPKPQLAADRHSWLTPPGLHLYDRSDRTVPVRRTVKRRSCVRVLIAIPVFNERKYVERVLGKVLSYHRDVLVVDDGSTDGTGDLLAARRDIRLIRHATNSGYGQSLIDAFNYADEHGFD